MYIRIVRGQAQPGQIEELAQRWETYFRPLREQSGVRHAYFAGDRQTGTTIAVSVWDKQPDAVSRQRMEEFRAQLGDLASAMPPTIDEFEVLADI